MINAHIVIIGDELLDGTIHDKNVKVMAQWLKELGVTLKHVTFARDEESTLLKTLEETWNSCHITITTGGLGPTKDDITKEVIAKLFDLPIKENSSAENIVKEHYERINRPWNKQINSYHQIPEGVTAVKNPCGLAPGLCYIENQKVLLAAPGVPRELDAMMKEEFSPIIKKLYLDSLQKTDSFVVRTHSIPEEQIFFSLEPELWDKIKNYGHVSSLPQITGVDIRISLNHDVKEKQLSELRSIFHKSAIANNIWQWGELSLPEFLLKKAREKNLTISCAESCTGGLTSSILTDIAGCSDVFMGSAVTYSYSSKEKILGVKKESLEGYGAVSEEVVREMAAGSLHAYDSDVAISFSGIAGPGGATKDKSVGTVAIAVGNHEKIVSGLYYFRGNRELLKHRFAMKGLFLLLDFIGQMPLK